MTRTRTLEAVSGIERRLRAASSAAAALAREAAHHRRHNSLAFAGDIHHFNASASRSSFACAVAAARRTMLTLAGAHLAARQLAADETARLAFEAVIPWSQMRAGLERRRARRAAKSLA
ncbi:MAG TPA: hypothetical protein VII69_07270 [Candidatus Eremiobacteraceae bacterium]